MLAELLAFAKQNPGDAFFLAWSVANFAASLLLAGFRAAYREPEDQVPRWIRFLEAVLEKVAMNSARRPGT